MQFVSQEAGKARQTNALMYNPTTDRYSIITNYNPETQGAKGIDIDSDPANNLPEGITVFKLPQEAFPQKGFAKGYICKCLCASVNTSLSSVLFLSNSII